MDWVIVPSVWWENAPLVIQEAFAHGRPVICSDVGGMAEAVRDGVDGLHFGRGDARSLAQTMQRAIEQPGLWQHLVDGIEPVRTIQAAADEHLALYTNLIFAANAPRWSAA
jgi:glycosyltransferase involved in cell wall biosynthesis